VDYGQSSWRAPSKKRISREINKVKLMVNMKLEIVFVDKEGKYYPIDEVEREDLAIGLEKLSKEVAKRLQLIKDQR
jgi:hypothetical protein